jgi:hypothetical protein
MDLLNKSHRLFARAHQLLPSFELQPRSGLLFFVGLLTMSTKHGLTLDSAIEIDGVGTYSKVDSPDTLTISHKEGRGFASLRGSWVSKHNPPPRWVYETEVLRNKKWPRYAILVNNASPRFELIKPRETFGKREIKLFRTLSADPWIRSCTGRRIRPISDGFMCLLIDMHLVKKSYPAVFESILCKLYYGDVPSPETGPMALLREIGLEYAVHYCSQIVFLELSRASDKDSLRSWDWSFLRDVLFDCYRNWYDKHRSEVICDYFSPVSRVGDFFRALEETISISSSYAKDVWNIAVAVKLQGSDRTVAQAAIEAWSYDGAPSWYPYV